MQYFYNLRFNQQVKLFTDLALLLRDFCGWYFWMDFCVFC